MKDLHFIYDEHSNKVYVRSREWDGIGAAEYTTHGTIDSSAALAALVKDFQTWQKVMEEHEHFRMKGRRQKLEEEIRKKQQELVSLRKQLEDVCFKLL